MDLGEKSTQNNPQRAVLLASFEKGADGLVFPANKHPYWLDTGKLSTRAFANLARQRFETRRVGEKYSSAQSYALLLPGFTSAEAQIIALAFENLRYPFVGAFVQRDPESFNQMVNLGLRNVKRKALPRFNFEAIQVSSSIWELRPPINDTISSEKAIAAVFYACTNAKILRFVYPMSNSEGHLTRRVKVQSIYGVDRKPLYFKGEYEGKVKTYSFAKCSKIIIEELAAEQLLPTLALEAVVPDNSSELSLKLDQIDQLQEGILPSRAVVSKTPSKIILRISQVSQL